MSQTFLKTGSAERITDSAGGITINVPIALKRRAGRALVTLPEGKPKGLERPWDGGCVAGTADPGARHGLAADVGIG